MNSDAVKKDLQRLVGDILQLGERATKLNAETLMLGNLPELDSMAVATLIAAMEEFFDFFIEDDEISAETFETFGSLCSFVEEQLSR